jgi:hypothetical protein
LAAGAVSSLSLMTNPERFWAIVDGIKCPVLVIHGGSDRTVPAKEDRLTYEPWLVKKPKLDTNNPYDDMLLDAGLSALPSDPFMDDDAGTPWYLRDWDGGKPQVTLDDLKGDGPIVRRMVKGFYVALDTEYEDPTQKTKWWKTTGGFLAPKDRMFLPKAPTDFHGVWLGEAANGAPAWPPAIAQSLFMR